MISNYLPFYLLAFIFIFGQFARIEIANTTILLNDLIISLTIIFWFAFSLIRKRKILFPKIWRISFIFFLFSLFTLIIKIPDFPINQILISSFYPIRYFIYSLIFIVFINSKLNKEKIAGGLMFLIIIIASIGILQYMFFPDMRFLQNNNWDPHYFRLTAPFLDPTFTGAILILGLFLFICVNFEKKITPVKIIAFLLILIASALTYSRATYLMYFIGISSLGMIKKSIKFFLITLLSGIIIVSIIPKEKSYGTNLQREETANARIQNWKNSITIIKDHPLFGTGFNTYRYIQKKYNFVSDNNWEKNHAGSGADSSLLFVIATTGIIGLLIYLYFLYTMIFASYKNLISPYGIALFVSIISLLGHSMFSNSLFYPFIMEWIWILIAINQKDNVEKIK